MELRMKKILVIIGILLILIAIPATIFLVKQNQEMRSKAAPATSLALIPANITKNIGDSFDLTVQIDTGLNEIFVAALYIAYDPTKLEAVSITNGPLFPNVLISGAIDTAGKASITVGAANQMTPIKGTGIAATVKFKALAATSGPISVQFVNPDTFVGAKQEGATNVLVGSVPARITINSDNTQSGASGQNNATFASQSATIISPTPSPTISLESTPQVTPSTTITTASLTPTQTTTNILTVNAPVENSDADQPELSGKAPPNTNVTITIHSTPITITVTSDANGNWSYIPTTPLDPGAHNIVVTATDPANNNVLSASTSFVVTQNQSDATGSATPVTGNFSATAILTLLGIIIVLTGLFLPLINRWQ
jgi:hypothetical protein